MLQPTTSTSTITVLVVEDDPTVRFVERYLLEDAGYVVVSAHDGDQALELAGECHPDLVVLDLGLPTISGFEVLHTLRENALTHAIPVIVVSSYAAQIGPEHHPYIAAMVTKPFETSDFLEVVARLLEAPSPSLA